MGVYNVVTDYLGKLGQESSRTQVAVASGAAVVVTVAAVYRMKRKQQYNFPPGPRPWPLVGNMIQAYRAKDTSEYLAGLKKTYGDIFTFYMGPKPVVILCTAELVREAFIRQGDVTSGRITSFTFDLTSFGGKDILGAQPHAIWKAQRALMHKAIRKFGTGQHMESLLYDSIDKVCSAMEKETAAFDPSQYLNLLVYNLMSAMTFGKRMEIDDPDFIALTKRLDELNEKMGSGLVADYFPIFRYIPTQGVRLLKEIIGEIFGPLYITLREHRETYDPSNVTDFTYTLLQVEEEMKKEENNVMSQLTEDHFVQLMSDMFFAGTDTTRYTLAWIIQYLARYPDIQRKLQTELDDVIGQSRRVALADKEKLSYTNAVMHEVMRLRPIVPLGIPHMTTESLTLRGYTLPTNTLIASNIRACHMDPRDWRDPEAFNPDRFLDEDGQFLTHPGWLPFSTGKRTCVGESLAKTDMLMFLAALFQRFTVAPPAGETLTCDCKLASALVMMPGTFKILVKTRE